jgi:hypothetical protein
VCMVICVVKDKMRYKIKIRWFFGWVSRRYTTRDAIHNSAMLDAGPSHPDTKARCTAMTIRAPLYKPKIR